jgi:hypothetical protein
MGIMKLLILFSILIVGCQFPFHYQYLDHYPRHQAIREIKVWIDARFGNADRVEIVKAVDQWNYALNGWIELEVQEEKLTMQDQILRAARDERDWLIMDIQSSNPIVLPHDQGHLALAFTDAIGGYRLYVVRDRDDNADIKLLMLHEIGHLLGASHTTSGLMSPLFSTSAYQCIDYETMIQVSEYQRLPIDELNYCKYYDESIK